MSSLADLLLLALPVLLLSLIAGLGLGFAVLMSDGKASIRRASRIVAFINLGSILPLVAFAVSAEAVDVRGMFAFAAAAFAVVGGMGLRFPARFDD